MATKKQQTEAADLGLEAEQHPQSKMWRYIWCSPGAAECLGLFKHTSQEEALEAGRAFAEKQLKANADAAAGRKIK